MRPIPLHVALTFDENYWAPAYAVMRSICLASRRPGDLVFHLIHTGLDARRRDQLDAIAIEFPVATQHTDLTTHPAYRAFVDELPIGKPFTPIIYARLLLDRLLPPDVERVIYIDSDTFVRGPIEDLAELDLAGKPIAAVLDPGRHKLMLGRDFRQNADLFDFHFAYFNSGMMVIDRKAFGIADLPGQTRRMYESGLLARLQYDQAVLNLVFKDNWRPLDFRWNLICPLPAHEVLEPQPSPTPIATP
jgi:lipopolysaccharide biosynthesis glycosyltransferase